jgi:hypothetical protein
LRRPYRRVLRSRQPGPKHKVPGPGWPSERAIAVAVHLTSRLACGARLTSHLAD